MRCPRCNTLLVPDGVERGMGADGSIVEWWRTRGFKKKRCPVCQWSEK